jgi:hypothetical protein
LGRAPECLECAAPGSLSAGAVRLVACISSCKAGAARTPAPMTGDAARSKHFRLCRSYVRILAQ